MNNYVLLPNLDWICFDSLILQGRTRLQTRSTLKEVSPRDLTCRDQPSRGISVNTNPWLLLDSSLFCCPSITAQSLRAAVVAAELPLRGKLRAEATYFFID